MYSYYKRLECIDFLRMLGAVLITLYHMDFQSSAVYQYKIFFSGIGNFAVSLFIVLSGFLASYSFSPKDITKSILIENVKKKVKKVYPLHIATLLAMLGYKYVTHSFVASTDITALILQVFMLQGFSTNRAIYYSFNKVSWYLTLYLWFAVLEKPLNNLLHNNIKSIKNCLLLMGLVIVSELLYLGYFGDRGSSSHWLCYICPFFRTLDYLIGILFGIIFKLKKNKTDKQTIDLTVTLFFAIMMIGSKNFISGEYYKAIYGFMTGYLVYVFACVTTSSFYSNKLFKHLGEMSFNWFLVHQMIIGFVSLFIKNELLILLIIIVMTYVCCKIWEYLLKKIQLLLN